MPPLTMNSNAFPIPSPQYFWMQQIFGAGMFKVTILCCRYVQMKKPIVLACMCFHLHLFSLCSQQRGHMACSCMVTCLRKTTSLARGCCCSRKQTCETWGSGPKVTSCTSRYHITFHTSMN